MVDEVADFKDKFVKHSYMLIGEVKFFDETRRFNLVCFQAFHQLDAFIGYSSELRKLA